MVATEDAFRGTERFTLRRCLGSGSFGKVYEAFDHERGVRVAIKVPHASKPSDLLRLKQEFRSLADISHPNLATLHELRIEGEQWFFTMEMVEGKDFFAALRGSDGNGYDTGPTLGRSSGRDSSTFPGGTLHPQSSWNPRDGGSSAGSSFVPPTYPCSPPKDFGSIRRALLDIVHGLEALHEAGIIHRDLKPGNVLITPQGRVVILDFGLATPLMTEHVDGVGPAGTPAFIAPEQLQGGACSPASDWYSLGVMLYQVLTGQPPYVGTYMDIVKAKADMDPCPPSLLVEGLPEDLEGLCMALLERDPELRPNAREILARLAAQGGQTEPQVTRHLPVREVPGREVELGLLMKAYQQLQGGGPSTVWLHGEAGAGKSGLLKRFMKELRRSDPAVQILFGRCSDQETVPFKALDSLVDVLSVCLKALPPLKCKALLPRHIQALVHLFPVLGQVPSLAELPTLEVQLDALELRRRAFAAFRELLGRFARLYPLVLVLEDLQWGDLDSAALLEDLFRPPDAPVLMLVISFRSDDLQSSPVLRHLCGSRVDTLGPVTEIALQHLSIADSRDFARGFLDGMGRGRDLLAERIAWESGGNPFFIRELAHFLSEERGACTPPGSGLESYIQDRVQALPEEARELLQTVSLAGCPVSWPLAREAMGHRGRGYHGFSLLRASRLLRVRGSQEEKVLEPYHEQIRKTVVGGMSPQQVRALSLQLATAMESRGEQDASLLAARFKAGGAAERAAHYFGLAGGQAERALAFDRAATLFGEALALLTDPYEHHRALAWRHADVLSNAGRSAEAAEAYLRLLPWAQGPDRVLLRRRASEEFMRSGHMDRGIAILEDLLPLADARMPGSPTQALLSVLGWRILLKLRGLSFKVKPKAELSEGLLQRIDILWAATMGFGPVDPIMGAGFQARQLLYSLRAGEPLRLIRALAHEAVYLAHAGLRSQRQTERVLARVEALASQTGQVGPLGRAMLGAGIAAILQGRWKAGAERMDRAERLLRGHGSGLDYEIHIAQFQSLVGYSVMGDLPEVSRRLPELLQEARRRGDLLALTDLQTGYAHFLHLAQDDPERARSVLRESLDLWSKRAFHAQHYNALVSRLSIELYAGNLQEAQEDLERSWPLLRGSMLLRVQAIAITCWELRARILLGLEIAQPGSLSHRSWKAARGVLRAIEGEGTPYGHALALRLMALNALATHRAEEAQGFLLRAEVAFGACDMALHAITARYGRALLQGEAGRELRLSAETEMAQRGIRNPRRYAAMHLAF